MHNSAAAMPKLFAQGCLLPTKATQPPACRESDGIAKTSGKKQGSCSNASEIKCTGGNKTGTEI